MKILNTIALTVIFSVTLFAAQGFAQSANTTADGTVLAPLTISATSNLDFGTEIFPGIAEVVLKSETGAAQFDITGEADKQISATFTELPTNLSDGTNDLPITFSTTDAGYAATITEKGSSTAFDPNTGGTASLVAGELYIWLGGTVNPATTQTAGAYSAAITLEIAYTGN